MFFGGNLAHKVFSVAFKFDNTTVSLADIPLTAPTGTEISQLYINDSHAEALVNKLLQDKVCTRDINVDLSDVHVNSLVAPSHLVHSNDGGHRE